MLTAFVHILTSLCGTVFAQSGETEIVTGVIPPYTYQEVGNQKGLIVEIVEAMARVTGHSGRIKFLPWKRALMEVTEPGGVPRLIIPLNRSPEREDKFLWVQELYVDKTVLVTKKGAQAKIETVDQALNLKTGVLLGSPLEAQLKRLGFREIEPTVDEETNARKLQFGRIAVWHVARLVAPFVFERHGFAVKDLEYGPGLDENDLYLGASKNLPPEQVEKWRKAFQKIKDDGTLEKIVKKYSFE
jgi:ABC-type amino acid transport substrate-binding protein